jgi:hypothetical protein
VATLDPRQPMPVTQKVNSMQSRLQSTIVTQALIISELPRKSYRVSQSLANLVSTQVPRLQRKILSKDWAQEHHVSILVSTFLVNNLPTGYVGKRTRCTDRFVRYPYPKQLYSNYKQCYPGGKLAVAGVKNHKEAFNLEKEAKIINPHKMEL